MKLDTVLFTINTGNTVIDFILLAIVYFFTGGLGGFFFWICLKIYEKITG